MCATDKRIISKLEKRISKLEAENQRYKKMIDGDKTEKQSAYEYLNHMVDDDNYLYGMTGMDREEFEWIQKQFINAVEDSPETPRFSEYVDDPGNTCILTVKQVLFIVLCRKRNNLKQGVLAFIADVDQSTISRYLTFSDELLMDILPTAKNIGVAIRTIRTSELFKKFVPGRGGGELYLDATFVQVQRPQENQETVYYSGKRKRHVYSIQITSNKDGVVNDIGGPEEGSVHDMEVLRRNPPNFGKWTDGMKNSDTKKERQITLYTDKGYLSVEKDYPGIISKQPYKKPKGRGLTETEREYSKRISRKRIKVEHAINRLKWFRRMSAVYDDTMDAFYTEIQVVTGLTNLHIMLKDRKYIEPLEKVCPQIK